MKRGTGACKIQLCDNMTQDYFTNQGTELQTIHTMHQQAAQYYNGNTYVVFHGPSHDIYIKAYDHSKEKWTDMIYVADNSLPPGEGYGAPSLCIDDLGYLHIFYGSHTGALKYVKSTNSEDIYNWTTMSNPTTHATYPQAFSFYWNSSCWIYLIYRGSTTGDGGRGDNWSYRKSEDRGETWGSEVEILTGWKTNGDEHGYYLTVQLGTDPQELSDVALHLVL